MKTLKKFFIVLFFLFLLPKGQAASAFDPVQRAKPFEINVRLRPEEQEWWERMEAAASEVKKAGKEMDEKLYPEEDKPGQRPRFFNWAEAMASLPKEVVAKFKSARERFQTIVLEGIQKDYRGPVDNAKARVIWIPRPIFSKEARMNKICGVVVVRVPIDKTGTPGTLSVVNSYSIGCLPAVGLPPIGVPNPPRDLDPTRLGNGLDNAALESVGEALFFPTLRDRRPVASRALISLSFEQKI